MMKKFSILILIFAAFTNILGVLASIDPYATLGVGRSATVKQIKKSYKQLAREWHPDKNHDPEAGDRFIEIQRAYEILSDKEKRSQFDRYGHVDDNENHHQRGNTNMFRGFQSQGGGGYSFKFSSQGGGGQRSHHSRVTLRKLEGEIFPGSYSKPFVLLLTGDWCFSCIRVEGIWDQVSAELEKSGIGSGKVNADYDYNVLGHLGVYSKPSIVAVVQETAYKYKGNEVSAEHIKNFVASLLPTDLITRVTDANRHQFLSRFLATNKPSVLLFTRRSTPSALYKLLAFKFSERMNFGFVQTTDSASKQTINEFDVQQNQREMLIFKENLEIPAEDMEISNVEAEELSRFLSENQHLFAPRLTSQTLYEQLCPESPYSHSKSYCIILCLKEEQLLGHAHMSFIQVAMTTDNLPVKVKFAYLAEERQPEFVQKLGRPSSSAEGSLPVLILWRVGARRAHWKWLPGGWHGDDPHGDRTLLVHHLASIQWGKAKELPELINEFAPNFFVGLCQSGVRKVRNGFRSLWNIIAQGSLNEVSLFLLVVLIYLGCALLMFLGIIAPNKPDAPETPSGRESRNQKTAYREDDDITNSDGEVRRRRQTPQSTADHRLKEDRILITSLNSMTYDTHIRNLPKSQILLVLLVTEETREELFIQLKEEVYHHVVNSPVLSLAHLNLDKYSNWCNKILNKTNSKNALLGAVLAIRPSKHYFSVFGSNLGESHDFFDSSEEDGLAGALDGLDMWIARLLDGGLEKIEVEQWPELED